MSILLLIDNVRRLGVDFIIKEEQLYIENAVFLPGEILYELKQAKAQLYLTFKRDQTAKEQGLLTYLHGTLYGCSISLSCDIYVENINQQWIAWQECHKQFFTQYRVIGMGYEFAYVLLKVEKFLSNKKTTIKKQETRIYN